MRGFVRAFSLIAIVLGLLEAPALEAAPARVVSMSVCTDQLAMLVAAPGQLVSVSHLARDPSMSAMSAEARAYEANHGRAEEIYLLQPDVVLASTYSNRATVAMLERVGIEVVEFAPATSLDDVALRLRDMGGVLGREAEAKARVRAYRAGLRDRLRSEAGRAALYGPGGYYRGGATLAGDILRAAGYATISDEVGRDGGGSLPLELMIMAAPDLLVTPGAPEGASRAHALLEHPALEDQVPRRALTNSDWICGTPAVLGAIDALVEQDR